MKDKDLVRTYINNFRRHLSSYLLPGIGLRSVAILAKKGGGVVKIAFCVNSDNADEMPNRVESVSEAVAQSGLKSLGNVEGVTFSGTNMVLEKNDIFLIKDESPDSWSDKAAKEDVLKIVNSSRRNRR